VCSSDLPSGGDLALVQSDGVSSHTLKVINRETGKQKFSQSLPEIPLVLEFSPKGTFLVVSKADWKSLTFYNAQTGRTISYLRDGFGIVSFLTLSASENTLLTYIPSSGNFTYWELKTGKQKEAVRSFADLKNLCLYNQRYVLAARGQDIVAVDMVSGAAAAAVRSPDIQKIIAGQDGQIVSLSLSGGKTSLQKWMFIAPVGGSPGILSRTGEPLVLPEETADAVLTPDSGYFALSGGAIGCMVGGMAQMEKEGLSPLNPITDILAVEGVLYALAAEKLYTLTSDLFSRNISDPLRPSFFSVTEGVNPLQAPARIMRSGDGDIFFFTAPEVSPGKIARVDIENRKILSRYTDFSLPLLSVQEAEGYLFALEKNGSLKKIDSSSMKAVYDYPAWNIQTFTPVDKKIFWAGKNRTGEIDSPLLMVNTETGETVPVKTPSALLLVSHMIHDVPRGRIYYLGLAQGTGGRTETRIFSANNPQKPESSASFGTYAAAGINAVIHIDSAEFAVYTTLGNMVVQKWSGSRWSNFESNNTLVVSLRDYGRLLFGINLDGSVSAWEKRSGKLVGTFCVLKDGTWIAASRAGTGITSRETGLP
jgi:WD40 repeat protein